MTISRGFWSAIGGIAGFYAGGYVGLAIAHARVECCYGETMYPFFGSIAGILIGPVVAWIAAGRWGSDDGVHRAARRHRE